MATEYEAEYELLLEAVKAYQEIFGEAPEVAGCAPGRVNLIGEHTDYNDGFVLPMALPLLTILVGKRNGMNKCRVVTKAEFLIDKPSFVEFPAPCVAELQPTNLKWANYVMGVCAFFKEAEVPGFDAVIVSNVPIGAGLSSSAALEVSTYTFLEQLTESYTVHLPDKAMICKRAENEFVGVPSGIMDQYISTMARPGTALLIDCRSLNLEEIPLENPDLRIVLIDSRISHDVGSGEYEERVNSCMEACKVLEKESLRDADLNDLHALMHDDKIDKTTFRRAHHVLTEIQRTMVGACCLRKQNYHSFGQLMYQSHTSLSHDYEVSCVQLDELVEIAKSVEGVVGSRMTGAGFGGCTVTLIHKACVSKLISAVEAKYNGKATFYVVTPSAGTRRMPLEGFTRIY